MAKRLKGTGVALITPFRKDGSIDHTALENLVNTVIKGGVDFLVALGTTGETPTLSYDEKQEIITAVLRYTDSRIPVVCGMGGNNTQELIHQLDTFDLRGVDTILSVTPYYNKPTQEGLYQHFKAVATATNKNIVLYNVPGRTGGNILPATVLRLATEFKNIVGIKEASGNLAQCMELIRIMPDSFIVLSGDDNMALAHLAIGMQGIISVVANCCPVDFTVLVNLAIINKLEKARKIHYKLLPGIDLLFTDGNPAGVKYALSKLGRCENELRLPLVPVGNDTASKLDEFLSTVGYIS